MSVQLITLYSPQGAMEYSNPVSYALNEGTLQFVSAKDPVTNAQTKYTTNLPFLIEEDS
jgi:hypothetical protein